MLAYEIQLVHELKPNDYLGRRTYGEWAQNQMATDSDFHKKIFHSEKGHFWLNVRVNKQNWYLWGVDNPQAIVETLLHPQKGCVVYGQMESLVHISSKVKPAIMSQAMSGFFEPELVNVDDLWFQQDGATCHTANETINLLQESFGGRIISRRGPVRWPPRSCDLTPLDYFWQGYVKSLVYADKPETIDV